MRDNFLSGKNILFFGIGFYDYEDSIKKQLENYGATVDFYLDQPRSLFEGFSGKIISLLKVDKKNILLSYHKKILKKTASIKYDFVFVLKGEMLTTTFLKDLKHQQQNAIFIMYQWDSINRVSNALELMPYFDRAFSFDRIDCQQYEKLDFRPLFFRVLDREVIKKDSTYDLVFIGFLHADRMELIRTIQDLCMVQNIKTFIYLFTGIKTYIQSFFKGKSSNLYIKPLNYIAVNEYNSSSKVVLDLPHPLQSGLTMRTIEAIGSKKKLITTNVDIVNYDFYNSKNILLIERENLKIDRSFFEIPYIDVPLDIYKKYTLEEWVEDIFYSSDILTE